MAHLATQTTLVLLLIAAAAGGATQVMPGCRERCGAAAIPYPFGVGEGCFLEHKFSVTCNDSNATNPTMSLGTSNITVKEIFVGSGELQVMQYIAHDCYTESGSRDAARSNYPIFWMKSFTISSTRNKFFAVGCDTYAIVRGHNRAGERFMTGSMSLCDDRGSINGDWCSGVGCCEASIPAGLKNRTVRLSSYNNHTDIWGFNPCSYAFTVQSGQFNFSGVSSFSELDKIEKLPMIVDWSVGAESCEEAKAARNVSYCKANSKCVDSKTGSGYLCECLPGYEGNPYHPHGCRDIDECKMGNLFCNGTCINLPPGNYTCSCPKGFTLTNRTLCLKDNRNGPRIALILYLPLGISIGLLALVFFSLMLSLGHRKRKLIRQKEKFFEQNGGLMLQPRLSNDPRGTFETAKIFTEDELIRATRNYQEPIGEGGYGIVYKGTLPNNKIVAIKKPKIGAQTQTKEQIEQFINEVVLLMQINHKNVVRLLGCCLDTEVPILVYEFITNGTLFQHIHKKASQESSLSWEQRLKIATETAGALAYLHFEINTPILHRDIKTMNILLDENYTAKVADFGTSRLIPLDEDELSTLVQGTIGYLDPEYLQSSQLTEKSDVYSFGVVLAELLTGKKALSFNKIEGTTTNLAMSFLSLTDDNQLRSVIDEDLVDDANMEAIKEVVSLAKRCLRIKGDERPTMKEVAMELEGLIRATTKHPWEKIEHEESAYLLGSPLVDVCCSYDLELGSSGTTSGAYDSMQNQQILARTNDGR